MRDAFATALINAGEKDPRIFVLDADCSHSTRSYRFHERFPHRFLNVGIAEQNMVGLAAGLALEGFLPVICGFAAIMVGRACEQISQSIAYPGLKVIIAGHYAGMSAAREGAPHHSISDIASIRAIPGIAVFTPTDSADVGRLLGAALGGDAPSYLRLSRDPVADVELNRTNIRVRYPALRRQTGDILIVACGGVTHEVVRAAEILATHSLGVEFIAVTQIKPFPTEVADLARSFSLIVSIEEHSIIGGLGDALATAICNNSQRHLRLGIPDCFTQTGDHRELLSAYGLLGEQVAAACLDHLPIAKEEL